MILSGAFEMLANTQVPYTFCKLKAEWQLLIQCCYPKPRRGPMLEKRQFRAEGDSGEKRKDHAEKLGISVVPEYEGGRNGLNVTSGDF